jgi:PPE-repeat protein
MNFRNQKILTASALFVIFAVSQVYIGVSFANPNGVASPAAGPQQLMGILTTRDNQPILVNGVSAVSGATIPSGATIETPDKVGATINIGALGSLCIAPNTRLTIQFSQSGNAGDINANLSQGCVILTTLKNVKGAIVAAQAGAQISPKTGGTIDVCLQPGEAAKVNQAAAANAGAGASGLGCNPPAGAAAIPRGLFGLGRTATAAIFAGTGGVVACIVFCNPSPSTP